METLTGMNSKIFYAAVKDHHFQPWKPYSTSKSPQFHSAISKLATYTSIRQCCFASQVIHCLPISKSEEGLATETSAISKSVCVKFQLENECHFGDHILMVGDDPVLGSWNPSDAVPFDWSEGHIWALVLELPINKPITYKFLLKKSTGEILWQPGPDRVFQSWETDNVIVVTEEWFNAEAQMISEEHQITDDGELIAGALVDSLVTGSPSEDLDKSSLNVHINDAALKDNSSISATATQKTGSSNKNSQEKVPPIKGSPRSVDQKSSVEAEEEVNLSIDDEGMVLVPGLTLPFISSEEA